jgi:ATP phosphoribosyltransferase
VSASDGLAPLTLALPKGRVLREAVAVFAAAGLPEVREVLTDSRRLLFRFPARALVVLVVRDADVPTYVEQGAADCGVVGKDVLLEQDRAVYEPLDLGIGRCRLVLAAPAAAAPGGAPSATALPRVATKFPRLAARHFAARGEQVEVIRLSGAIELAPLVGLADRIVDLVQTGETLRQNGLVEVETILEATSRLIVNRASLKTKPGRLNALIADLRRAVAAQAAAAKPQEGAPAPGCVR